MRALTWLIRQPGDTALACSSVTYKALSIILDFVNKIGAVAEEEQHHPNITILYNKVRTTLSTHAIGGLSQNDFIMAAKIDQLNKKL